MYPIKITVMFVLPGIQNVISIVLQSHKLLLQLLLHYLHCLLMAQSHIQSYNKQFIKKSIFKMDITN